MTDIELPLSKDRHGWYRFFEILPGVTSYFMLVVPLLLSLINVTMASIFILVYLLTVFARSMGVCYRAFQGYNMMEEHKKLPWRTMLAELEAGEVDTSAKRPTWHNDSIVRLSVKPAVVKPSQLLHVVIIATYNETRAVIEPTIQSILNSDYDMNQVILVLAYEERGGPEIEAQSNSLIQQYASSFKQAVAIKHPRNIPNELRGKGGNITFAGREIARQLAAEGVDPLNVVVTTLDSDNRPHPQYLAALSYLYSVYPDPVRISIQPISVYNNNIWDAPAPMRVIATGNTFFNIVIAQRPHMLRNFSAHAQGLQSLLGTNFWSVRTIVEDGHQFWRSYFAYDGNYRVLPLFVPIYQDAVLADGYVRTLKAQFIQLRRWTYGASDIAYVITQGFFKPNKVPRLDLIAKTGRLFEGHITWAVGPLISLYSGFIPLLIYHRGHAGYTAAEIPIIVSHIQTIALVALSASLFICFKTLPPRPARYRRHRTLFVVVQWVYLPLTTVVYNSFAAFNSQTRLIFGKYLDKFDVTEKAVKTETGNTISRDTAE